MQEETYYDVLEVPEGATLEEIKRAHRQLANEYHPDKIPEQLRGRRLAQDAVEAFRLIQEAYEVLSNRDKRRQYDESLRKLRSSDVGADSAPPPRPTPPPRQSPSPPHKPPPPPPYTAPPRPSHPGATASSPQQRGPGRPAARWAWIEDAVWNVREYFWRSAVVVAGLSLIGLAIAWGAYATPAVISGFPDSSAWIEWINPPPEMDPSKDPFSGVLYIAFWGIIGLIEPLLMIGLGLFGAWVLWRSTQMD